MICFYHTPFPQSKKRFVELHFHIATKWYIIKITTLLEKHGASFPPSHFHADRRPAAEFYMLTVCVLWGKSKWKKNGRRYMLDEGCWLNDGAYTQKNLQSLFRTDWCCWCLFVEYKLFEFSKHSLNIRDKVHLLH